MRFHLTANAQFEAQDLNDALGQLTQHFADLMGGQPDGNALEYEGQIYVDAPSEWLHNFGNAKAIEPPKSWFSRLLGAVGWRA